MPPMYVKYCESHDEPLDFWRWYRSGWNESSISLMYQHSHLEEKVSSFAGANPAVVETCNTKSTQPEAKEVVMDITLFKLNLMLKWVVGLVVSLSLGLCVFLAQSYITSSTDRVRSCLLTVKSKT